MGHEPQPGEPHVYRRSREDAIRKDPFQRYYYTRAPQQGAWANWCEQQIDFLDGDEILVVSRDRVYCYTIAQARPPLKASRA
jgi:hypothetical protein